MKKIIHRYLLLLFLGAACLAGCGSGIGEREESRESQMVPEDTENLYDSLAAGSIADLGNHIAAYVIAGEKLDGKYGGTEYLVVRDLEKKTAVCIPNSFGELLDVSIAGSGICVKYMVNGTEAETVLPVCFPDRDGEGMEMNHIEEKVIYGTCFKEPELPVKIWEESIEEGGEERRVSFYRTSPPYENLNSDFMGLCADYLLTAGDREGNVIWEQVITHYLVDSEEVYWMLDVSGDGYTDLIFCTDYISQPLPNAELQFFIWDEEKRQYVLRNPPEGYVHGPLWNEEMSGFVFYEKGFNNWVHDTKIYTCNGEGWRLCAEIIIDSENKDKPYFEDGFQEEAYYKELDYFLREIVYREESEAVETIHDIMWDGKKDYYDKDKYLRLYPEGCGWERVEMEFDTGGTVNKYVRKTGSEAGSD